MSRIAFVADVHVGNPSTFGGPVVAGINARGREVLATLERAVEAVQNHDLLVICGDLFDVADPTPQLVAEVQRILSAAPKVAILLGNHDMVSEQPGDNALGPLSPLPNVLPIERPELLDLGDALLLAVPFQTGDAREWFPVAVERLVERIKPADLDKPRIMAFHLGVADVRTPSFLRDAHDAISLDVLHEVMGEQLIAWAYCGNWHNANQWKTIVQCGALCPTGWDNAGWEYGLVRTLDTKTRLQSQVAVPGPRFLTVNTLEEAQEMWIMAQREKCSLYLNLKKDAATALEEIRGWGVKARAVHDTSETKAATHAAAAAVREAGTLQEALAKYVEQMPIGEAVIRKRVLELSSAYLAKGGTA